MAALKLIVLICAALVSRAMADCNPLTQKTCPAIPGLATPTYSIDFTQQKTLPSDWILAGAANVTFGNKGAEFNFNKRKDAPYIWTNFYVAYGRIDVELQVASGTGIITSAVMFSDDADEIDWEFSGSNLGAGLSVGKAQTNVFGKGITGNYDRGTLQDISPVPQTNFHTYSLDWTPDKIDWIVDGVIKYTTKNSGQTTGNYQFPQTPSRLHLGMWDAGDPDTAPGTRNWAGGYTDYSKTPYVALIRSVKITTPYPCKTWQYPDNFSGSWKDVKCTNETTSSSASASKTSSSSKSTYTSATYVVKAGDNGYTIADQLGCTFDQLSAANPGVDWDALNIDQKLNNPSVSTSVTSGSAKISSDTSSTPTKSFPISSQIVTTSTSQNSTWSNVIVTVKSHSTSVVSQPGTSSITPTTTTTTGMSSTSTTDQRRTSTTVSSTVSKSLSISGAAGSPVSSATPPPPTTSSVATKGKTTSGVTTSIRSSTIKTSSSAGGGWSYAGNNFGWFGRGNWYNFHRDNSGRHRRRDEGHQQSKDGARFGRFAGVGRRHV